MSKIKELIQKMCPNGVKFQKIGEISNYRRGSFPQPYTDTRFYGGKGSMPFVQVADVKENFRLVDKTKNTISKLAQPLSVFVPKGTVIVTLQGTIGRVAITQYDSYVDRTLAIFEGLSNNLSKKYFVYQLKNIFDYEKQFARGSTIKTITKEEMTNFEIPIPPLEVQNEIVRILDKYSELEAELEAELEDRRKQYEFWREKIISSSDEKVKIGDICDIITGGEVPKNTIKGDLPDDEHRYAVYGNGKEIYGYTNSYKIDKDCTVISSIGAKTGTVYFHKAYFTPIIRLKVLVSNEYVNSRYLYYALQTVDFGSKSGSVPNLNANDIKNTELPFFNLEKQNEIVNILDKFDKLINDISEGLPAEVDVRRKQYEYYRDKLLSFEKI
jgi:type I restriction enzyme S subunit